MLKKLVVKIMNMLPGAPVLFVVVDGVGESFIILLRWYLVSART